jgi:hypothetical protein
VAYGYAGGIAAVPDELGAGRGGRSADTAEVQSHSSSLATRPAASRRAGQDCNQASRSALIVAAWVVGMPCGNPWYVFSVPFCTSLADSGPESA